MSEFEFRGKRVYYETQGQGKPLLLLNGIMMVSLETGLTADAIDVGYDEDGTFYQTTPAYGGKILAHIVINERRPQMTTVHPKMFSPVAPLEGAVGKVLRERVDVTADDCYTVVETVRKENAGKSIATAEVIIAGGRGIKCQDDLAMETLSRLAAEGMTCLFNTHYPAHVLCN